MIPKLPSTRPRALTPPGFSDYDDDKILQRPAAAFQQSLWFKVPANLRRDILRLAFGDRRLHMHLAFDPSVSNPDDPYSLELDEPDDPGLGDPQRKLWSWNGCICARKYDPELGPMTRGGLNPGPWIDRCCDPINVPKPPPESIGIMGWLQSCRQKYISILYLSMSFTNSVTATPRLLMFYTLQTPSFSQAKQQSLNSHRS